LACWLATQGKTRVPVYQGYTQAGFDPNKDMLQTTTVPVEAGGEGLGNPIWCHGGSGAVVVEWDLRTGLQGLVPPGTRSPVWAPGVNRKAAAYAGTDRKPTEAEKMRV
jgi:hypothetical protein